MEEIWTEIGLGPKEVLVYQLLLQQGSQTATQLAEVAAEGRTNMYALLDGLTEKGLVVADRSKRVALFKPTDPMNLQRLVQARQVSFQQVANGLQTLMPGLRSQYSLSSDKPGVVHMAGAEGLLRLLDDMVRSRTEVLLVASDKADVEGIEGFKERLLRRKENGIRTRALAHDHDRDRRRTMYAERGMELRFLGELPFTGEVVVYEDNVAFTVYEPQLITTVVTNPFIAETMRTLFENLWMQAQ
jgi:sugar-specific transcriptional regulator TrmB